MSIIGLLFTACSHNEEIQAQTPTEEASSTLVVYYSFTGNSLEIVKTLNSQIACDVIEVLPAEKDIDYAANNYEIGSSQIAAIRNHPDEATSYPAIDKVEVDFSKYDTIIIVTPLWWSQMAAPMQTFLFQHGDELAGKSVGLIVSSHSSGINGVEADCQRLVSNGKHTKSLWINASNHGKRQQLIKQWLEELSAATNNTDSNNEIMKMNLTINGVTHSATLQDISSTRALLAQLAKGNITYEARDYGNFEKVGNLGHTFPQNNTRINTVAGDLILSEGNLLCIYYDVNTWNFTRLGKLDNMTQEDIKKWVNAGGGKVQVTLSLH